MVRFLINDFRNLALAAAFLLPSGAATAGLFCEWCVDPLRPYCSPEHDPNWGVHVTSWKQFPAANSQYGDFCPDCQAGQQMGVAPMQSFPGTTSTPSAIIIPQQPTAAPMVFQAPGVTPGAVYNSNPPQGQPGPMQPVPLQTAPMPAGPMQNAPNAASPGALVPLPMQTMPPAPSPMQNHLLPQPNNVIQPQLQPGNHPVPQPNNATSGPIPLPDFPSQTSVQSPTQNHLSSFAGQRPPIFNGALRQRVAPVPVYRQPAAVNAVPLIQNQSVTQPQLVPVTGVSYSPSVPQQQPQNVHQGNVFTRFLKNPKLPFFGK